MIRYQHDTEMAEYEDVKDYHRNVNLPSTLDSFSLIRHDLMKGKTDKEIESINEELQIDKALGLDNQAKNTVLKSLSKDIDELTSSNDYFEVSMDLLKKLFQITNLRLQCLSYNVLSAIRGFFVSGALPLSLHGLMGLLIYPMIMFSSWVGKLPADSASQILMGISMIIGWIGLVLLLIAGVGTWFDRKIEFDIMTIDLEITKLSRVTDKIPYGAKLKVLEAKKTGIFEDFVFVKPEFKIDHRVYNMPSIDPAILGVTKDNRMYMIVYWDIDKDVEKVIKQIDHFKKFKLDKTV